MSRENQQCVDLLRKVNGHEDEISEIVATVS